MKIKIKKSDPLYYFILYTISKMKTITINWVNFTQKKLDPYYNWKSDIFDLYKHPSQKKIKIFNYRSKTLNNIYWLTWNMHNFSIYWNIIDQNWQLHNVKITQSYNYILD